MLSNIAFQTALETLIRQENHFYKIIDARTILIAADTPQNRKTYEDLVIRTFFLSNADVTEVANALRALLQTTRISINKAENSVTLRDTADKVAVAERIVEQNDKQVSEVVVDVELLQINTGDLQDLGLELTPRRISASIPQPGGTTDLNAPLGTAGGQSTGQFSWSQLQQITINSVGFSIPSAQLTFIKDNTNAELLAKPQPGSRRAEGAAAIGSKVPVPVTSFQSAPAWARHVARHVVPVPGHRHQDRGRARTTTGGHPQADGRGVQPGRQRPGTTQPQFGTRTISSIIRLKDGETNWLASTGWTSPTSRTPSRSSATSRSSGCSSRTTERPPDDRPST